MCDTLAELFEKARTDKKYMTRLREMAARRATCEHRTTEAIDVFGAGWVLAEFCTNCLFEVPVTSADSN